MGTIHWPELFGIDTSLLEIAIHGGVVYLALFVLLRLARRRETAAMGVTDLLVLVLLADAAQNAMAGGYQSITDGIVLVAAIISCALTLDWLGYRLPRVRPLIRPTPVRLIQDGVVLT